MEQRDLVIIGGGIAGYVAAIRARQLGGKVTLVERDALGGTCLNRGCIPTRALVRGVEFLELVKKAKEYGVGLEVSGVDFAKMMQRKNTVVKTVVGGVELLMRENGVEVIMGKARLFSPSEVDVQMQDGSGQRLTAPKVIIAAGSSWRLPSVAGSEKMITTDDALDFKEIPRSMIVLGSGAIALAYTGVFAKLGTSVSVLERSAQILPGFDKEAAALLEREMRKDKVRVHTEADVRAVEEGDGGEPKIVLTIKGKDTTLSAQYVLAADERQSNVENLGLDRVGVAVTGEAIGVNRMMETNVSGLFAAGDVVGGHMLAHVALAEGRIAAVNAMGKKSEIDYTAVPRCVHTTPEVASVGLTEDEALAQGYEVRTGRFPFAANATATILGERTGFIKVVSEMKYGQMLGVHIIGPHAADLIQEATLAMRLEVTPQDVASTIHAHPTLSEAMMEAALDVTGETLHFLSANK
ncbi:MAG: dihydrolipoyl dehydrogenase [Dehalococcoidia bacterium]|nr:dihydrolipoyl dehydrogenase [Dehalococcoidia bacterium]